MSIGSWLRNHPRSLEWAYELTHRLFQRAAPLFARVGYDRADRWLRPAERLSKEILFDCRMCGQCVLHSTGMTCPMTCPKNLRNGPCGGVRLDGHCEVKPEMKCVWVEAFERSQKMVSYGHEMIDLQAPLNRQLEGSSAWINMLAGVDRQPPAGWVSTSEIFTVSPTASRPPS
jgi:hypothetical protein